MQIQYTFPKSLLLFKSHIIPKIKFSHSNIFFFRFIILHFSPLFPSPIDRTIVPFFAKIPAISPNSVSSMPVNGRNRIDGVEEGIWKMKLEDDNGESEESYPDRPGEPDCIYYLRTGLCGYGSKCRFNHPVHADKIVESKEELPQRTGQPDCGFYLKTGSCKYGSSCKFHHPNDRSIAGQAPLNAFGLPIRQEEKPCPYYMRTYTCKFGAGCKFNHPQPSSGSSAFGTVNSSVCSSTGMTYANGVSAWFLPRAPYMLGPRMAGPPQPYAPVVIPSSQGVMTAQGWNTYVGTVSPNIYGANFHNSKDREGFGTNTGLDSSMKISNLPERPDQPECRFFMSTGSCKYGSDCKYHHPKERMAQLSMYSLGPHGLPLRPGEVVCSHFRTYGVCKYGPTCKYDHPIAGSLPSYVLDPRHSSPPTPDQPVNTSVNSLSEPSKISEWTQKPELEEVDNEHTESREDVKEPTSEGSQ